MHLAVFIALAQIAIPPPRGYVNDFAGVLDPESIRHMEAVITELRAKTRGERESRSVPFSSLEREDGEPAVDPDRFGADGAWSSPPRSWEGEPEARLLAGEARSVIDAEIAKLPPVQRQVITLRDVEGFGAAEVRDLLDLTDGNQRVLLHRARSRVRRGLEEYLS